MDRPIGRGLGGNMRGGKNLMMGLRGGLVWLVEVLRIHCSLGWLAMRVLKGMGVGLEAEEDDGVEEGREVEDEARWGVAWCVECQKALACCVARWGVEDEARWGVEEGRVV